MVRKFFKSIPHLAALMLVVLATGCDRGNSSADESLESTTPVRDSNAGNVLEGLTSLVSDINGGGGSADLNLTGDSIIISDDATTTALFGAERELTMTDTTATSETVTQCLCSNSHRSTLQFYHFESQNAVLLIEFDNQTRDFTPTAKVHLFDNTASVEEISHWINNQHSDGLRFTAAEPVVTHTLSANAVSITSSVFVETISGDFEDEYEHTRIEFTVANSSEPDRYFLNGFADQSVVYLQTL